MKRFQASSGNIQRADRYQFGIHKRGTCLWRGHNDIADWTAVGTNHIAGVLHTASRTKVSCNDFTAEWLIRGRKKSFKFRQYPSNSDTQVTARLDEAASSALTWSSNGSRSSMTASSGGDLGGDDVRRVEPPPRLPFDAAAAAAALAVAVVAAGSARPRPGAGRPGVVDGR